MATLSDLRVLVANIIQDTSFNIDEYLNRGVNEIAGGMTSNFGNLITPPLPNLFKIDTVLTSISAAYVSMPATFQRKLQFVANSSGQEIEIYNSMIEFAQDHPLLDGSGTVQAVIEKGGNLYYQKIPSVAETLTLHFFRKPVDMTDSDDVPDGIPLHLQVPLLVNYACYKIYELIEDDINNVAPNTMKYKAFFQEALKTLELSLPVDERSLYLSD